MSIWGKNIVFDIEEQDRIRVVERLVKESSPRKIFLILVLVSTIVTTVGLLHNSASLVIGGMLVAPLLSPILSLGLGVVVADTRLLKFAAGTIGISMFIAVLTSFVIAAFSAPVDITAEILERTEILYMLPVAIAAGIAAVLAIVHKNAIVALPGVAVSVAVLPPISVVGIGIAALNWFLIQKSLGLFLINLIGIIFVCIIMFSLMGFSKESFRTERALDKEELVLEKKI